MILDLFRKRKIQSPASVSATFEASDRGWWLTSASPSPAVDYLEQLAVDGLAATDELGRYGVTWDQLNVLLADERQAESIYLLNLPPQIDAVPVIAANGTPSEPVFSIRLAGWVGIDQRVVPLPRIGAVLQTELGPRRMSPQAWTMLQKMLELSRSGANDRPDARMRAMGRIQQLGRAAGARMDDYLSRSPVMLVDQLDVQLDTDELGGELVVQVTPVIDNGPQQGWVRQLDTYDSVRARYDVTHENGQLSHLLLDEDVQSVTRSIKQFPGRRLFGESASRFLDNPYVFMDEGAERALTPERFEAARGRLASDAWRLHVSPSGSGWQARLLRDDGEQLHEKDIGLLDAQRARAIVETAELAQQCYQTRFSLERQSVGLEGQTLLALNRLSRWLKAPAPEESAVAPVVEAAHENEHEHEQEQEQEAEGIPAPVPEFDLPTGPDVVIEPDPVTDADPLTEPDPEPDTVSLAELLDLSQYGNRVVDIEGRQIQIPRINREGGGISWADKAAEALRGQGPAQDGDGTIQVTALNRRDIKNFDDVIRQAEESGGTHVTVPGSDYRMSVDDARQWLNDIKRLVHKQGDANNGQLKPTAAPRKASQVALSILHNIDDLEYIEASRQDPDFADEPYQAPKALRADVQLKQHQRQGVARMQAMLAMRGQGVAGMLLADDMGLGKTLQALALMAWYRQTSPQPYPCLIVAPVSLLENWKAEIRKFLDGSQGQTLTLYGAHLQDHRLPLSQIRPELRQLGLKRMLREGFADNAAFVLTTYETLRDFQVCLGRQRWGVLICDESQKIKTPSALVTRAAKAMQAEFRIACTGTPVENSLADLWCLFDFLQPGLLDSLSRFSKQYRQSIERREADHAERVEALRARIRPWVLRRMKHEVADLKPKHERVVGLPMSPLQRQLYRQAVLQFQQSLEEATQEQGRDWRNESLDSPSQATADKPKGKGIAALTLLHHLRMVCANPVAAAQEKADLVPVEEHLRHSPKLSWLLDKLEEVRQEGLHDRSAGQKVIVFTEFLPMQRIVQRAVASRFGFRPTIINGSTSVDSARDDSRQALIDAFQAAPGFGVIVLSTVAVGFGVNIQQANHVIHFTRPWNPAKEDQATDRAYRIGQTREVHVYYPTIVGEGFESFEERVADRLANKRSLSADMLSPEQALVAEDFLGLEAG